jgi:LEA14-like dessication related protein
MRNWLAGTLAFAIILSMGACATIEQLIQKPEITFDSLRAQDMSLLEGTFLFRFEVSNPNPVGVHLNDISYHLTINGEPFISGRLDQGLTLTASGTAPMEIPVTIGYLDIFNTLSRFIQSDALDYRLGGSAGVGPLRIPFLTSGTLDVPRMPTISVDRISVDRIAYAGASLTLVLGLQNPNAFAMNMDGLEYAARLGDLELAKGVARDVAALAKNGRSSMDVAVDLNFFELGRGAQALLNGSSAHCHLSGNMLVKTSVGMRKIPFQFAGKVPLSK